MYSKFIETNYHFYFSMGGDNRISFTLENISDEQARKIADGLTLARRDAGRELGHYWLAVTKYEKIRYEREQANNGYEWSNFTTKNYTHIIETDWREDFSKYGEEYDEQTMTTAHRVYAYTGEFINGFGKYSYVSNMKDVKYRE